MLLFYRKGEVFLRWALRSLRPGTSLLPELVPQLSGGPAGATEDLIVVYQDHAASVDLNEQAGSMIRAKAL